MLPRSHRLAAPRAIKRLYVKGRRFAQPTIALYVLPNHAAAARCAVIASKKVHAHATVRNRLKRVVRAELAQLLPTLVDRYDYLAVLRPAAAATPDQLRRDLRAALTQAGPVS